MILRGIAVIETPEGTPKRSTSNRVAILQIGTPAEHQLHRFLLPSDDCPMQTAETGSALFRQTRPMIDQKLDHLIAAIFTGPKETAIHLEPCCGWLQSPIAV